MGNNKTRCDSCQKPGIGYYKLTEYSYEPSFLCSEHGEKFIADARECRFKFSVRKLDRERA